MTYPERQVAVPASSSISMIGSSSYVSCRVSSATGPPYLWPKNLQVRAGTAGTLRDSGGTIDAADGVEHEGDQRVIGHRRTSFEGRVEPISAEDVAQLVQAHLEESGVFRTEGQGRAGAGGGDPAVGDRCGLAVLGELRQGEGA